MPTIQEPDIKNVEAHFQTLQNIADSWKNGSHVSPQDRANYTAAMGQHYQENRDQLLRVWNTNTISSDLKRQVTLQETMRAFKRRIISVNAFSTVFSNIPLAGTDEIAVPYYPLYTSASKSFVTGDGYVFDKDTDTQSKKVTINKRKYQPMTFYSETLRRQPLFDPGKHVDMMAQQLAVDVWTDILSIVTIANFGATAHAEPAAAFFSDDILDIQLACDQSDWPEVGRSMIMDSSYYTNVLKDPDVKHSDRSGSPEALRTGVVNRIGGFDIMKSIRIPDNSENLTGMAVFPSAILLGFSPIEPGPGVRNSLLKYEVVTDPDTGLSLEYRYWGESQPDSDYEIIECNYGYALGEAAALKRITSQ